MLLRLIALALASPRRIPGVVEATWSLPCRWHSSNPGLRGGPVEATRCCRLVLGCRGGAEGDELTSLLQKGWQKLESGDHDGAVSSYDLAAGLDPSSAAARCGLGRALIRKGRLEEGFESLLIAFGQDSLCPGVKDGFREYYRKEIEINPSNIDAYEGLAALCVDSGQPQEAAECYRSCLDLTSPTPPDGTDTDIAPPPPASEVGQGTDKGPRSSILRDDTRAGFSAAAAAAVAEEVDGSLGPTLRRDRWSVALFKCRAALCDWTDWEASSNDLRAAVCRAGWDTREPSITGGRGEGGDSGGRANTCGGGGGSGAGGVGGSFLSPSAGPPVIHPFDSLSSPLSAKECLAVARQQSAWVEARVAEEISREGGRGRRAVLRVREGSDWQLQQHRDLEGKVVARGGKGSDGRIRLGYVSGDLMGTHPLTHLMQSTFGAHDRSKFEIFLYALNPPDASPERLRLEQDVEHFRDLSGLTAREASRIISDDSLGVLVNLNGYAGTSKSAEIFTRRPAPVSVSYMGFPGSLGSSTLTDYLLADREVIPEDLRDCYSEKILELPHCYFANDYKQSARKPIAGPPPCRRDHGLPPGGDSRAAGGGYGAPRGSPRAGEEDGEGLVLCNFNRLHKIDPSTFGVWMEVLKAFSGSTLWLLDGGPTARKNLLREAEAAGVEGAEDRVIFAPLVGKEDHLRRLRLADIFVDTPLYNAHTVGCDALWAGVPIVTLRGQKMASRVGASLLLAAGLPELVTDSLEEYKSLLEALMRDGAWRRRLRDRLDKARFTCPLFDTKQWVLNAEKAFAWAWGRHEAGLGPTHFSVEANDGGDEGVGGGEIDGEE